MRRHFADRENVQDLGGRASPPAYRSCAPPKSRVQNPRWITNKKALKPLDFKAFLFCFYYKNTQQPRSNRPAYICRKKPLFGTIFTKSGFFSCPKTKPHCIFSTAAASVGADCRIPYATLTELILSAVFARSAGRILRLPGRRRNTRRRIHCAIACGQIPAGCPGIPVAAAAGC